MKPFLFALALFIGQSVALRPRPVVHLRPHRATIEPAWGGATLELVQAPPVVHLPLTPPPPDGSGIRWTIDVKNLGPQPVAISGCGSFAATVAVGATVHIGSNGKSYGLEH